MHELVSQDVINQQIFILRGHKVMLSPHLAEPYGVEAKVLIQAVKRNKDRFPDDFMFQLTWNEAEILKSQFVTSRGTAVKSSRSQNVTLKQGKNVKYLPYAFTEQGVAMLSSVLKKQAGRARQYHDHARVRPVERNTLNAQRISFSIQGTRAQGGQTW